MAGELSCWSVGGGGRASKEFNKNTHFFRFPMFFYRFLNFKNLTIFSDFLYFCFGHPWVSSILSDGVFHEKKHWLFPVTTVMILFHWNLQFMQFSDRPIGKEISTAYQIEYQSQMLKGNYGILTNICHVIKWSKCMWIFHTWSIWEY